MRKPEEEKKEEKIAVKERPIEGGAGSLPPKPVKEERERIVGGPGTYPVREEKKVKIAKEP